MDPHDITLRIPNQNFFHHKIAPMLRVWAPPQFGVAEKLGSQSVIRCLGYMGPARIRGSSNNSFVVEYFQ